MTKERVCFHVLLRKGWIGRARKGELIKHSGKFEHYKSEKSKRPLSAIPSSEAAQERQRSFSPRSHPRKVTLGGQPCSRPHTHTLHVRRHRLVPNFIRLERAVPACQTSNTPAPLLHCASNIPPAPLLPLLHNLRLNLKPGQTRTTAPCSHHTTPHPCSKQAQLTNPYAQVNPNNPSVPHLDNARMLHSRVESSTSYSRSTPLIPTKMKIPLAWY